VFKKKTKVQWWSFLFFEGCLCEGGRDRGVVGRWCDHCVSCFDVAAWFFIDSKVFLGLWVRLVLARVQYVFPHVRPRFRWLISVIVHWDCRWIRHRRGSYLGVVQLLSDDIHDIVVHTWANLD